jgi:hypothetical protein
VGDEAPLLDGLARGTFSFEQAGLARASNLYPSATMAVGRPNRRIRTNVSVGDVANVHYKLR